MSTKLWDGEERKEMLLKLTRSTLQILNLSIWSAPSFGRREMREGACSSLRVLQKMSKREECKREGGRKEGPTHITPGGLPLHPCLPGLAQPAAMVERLQEMEQQRSEGNGAPSS
jgi:hypothetical protein